MTKREVRFCNGCGKEIPHIRIEFKSHSENGYEMGSSCIPFGIIDYGDNGWQLCTECFNRALKNKNVLHIVENGSIVERFDPKKHKPKQKMSKKNV